MENQDKIYNQFKNAAEKVETNEFARMDKVWATIEGKLETKALKNENTIWKKIAVAASILVIATFGYQFLNNSKSEESSPKENVVTTEIQQKAVPDSINSTSAIVETEAKNPLIKNDAEAVIKADLATQQNVAVVDNLVSTDSVKPHVISRNANESQNQEKSNGYLSSRKFEAIGVTRLVQEKESDKESLVKEKAPPLVIIDGKPVKLKDLNFIDKNNTDSIQYLENPLYIINGKEYSEKELFGPNPTSPYFPLNEQKIISTTVLQGESATNLYGEKGKNGVIILATKNKKHLKK